MSQEGTDKEKKEYAIGYRRPPVNNRFEKGKSGNLKGRPKGAKGKVTKESLVAIIQEEASRAITVNQGEEKLTITMTRATVRSLFKQAIKGDVRAMKLFFEMVEKAEKEAATLPGKEPQKPIYRFSWILPDDEWVSKEELQMVKELRKKNGEISDI